jgi:hypothetical protein
MAIAAVDSRGRIYALNSDRTEIGVYSNTGALVAKVGRRGTGPAEFVRIGPVVIGVDDSVYVFDQVMQRATVLTKELQVSRVFSLPLGPENAELTAGRTFVVSGTLRTPESIGIALHELTPTGGYRIPWPETGSAPYAPGTAVLSRLLARGAGDAIWSAHRNRYRIDRWQGNGTLAATWERDVSWFEPWERWRGKPARTTGLRVDSLKRLVWFAAATGGDADRTGSADQQPRGERFLSPLTMPKPSDFVTRLDAIDELTASVAATARLEGFVYLLPQTPFFVRLGLDADGGYLSELHQYWLIR